MFRRLAVLLVTVLLTLAGATAWAESPMPQPSQDGANPVGACLADGQVWLFVTDENGEVLANQCVGTPASGTDALDAAGVPYTADAKGFICAIANHPETCPTTFNGQYWNYHHATAGSPWTYYEVGASDSKPEPGAIEGWCYNKADEDSCTPPLLKVVQDGKTVVGEGVNESDLTDPEVTADTTAGSTNDSQSEEGVAAPWTLIAVIGVLVVAAVVVVVVMRRGKTQQGVTGGR